MTLLADINEASARRGIRTYGAPPRPIAGTQRTTPAYNAGPLGPSRLQQMAAQARAAGPQQQQEDEGAAWQQGIGLLLNNPVAKAAMVPLNWMAAPMRAVEYGYSEAVRQMPDELQRLNPIDVGRAAEANEQGFMESLLDPDYGAGQLLKQVGGDSEWAKWANRATGLAGDIALDPTTYLTLGAGTGTRFAGQAGRATLAGMASRLGMSEEIIARAARLGPHGLKADELAKLGIRRAGLADIAPDITRVAADLGKEAPQQGIRFAGARIPGTTRISEPLTRVMAEARAATNRAPGMSRLRRLRAPEGLEDAFEKLATGRDPRAGPMSSGLAAELVDWDNTRRMASGSFRGTFAELARPWVQQMKGSDPQAAVRAAEQGEGELARILGLVADEADRRGVNIWRNQSGVGTKGYVPHVWTPDARRWFSKTDDFGKELRKEFGIQITDMDDESGVLLQRKIKAKFDNAGKPIPYVVKGREVTIVDDTIDGINKAFQEAFPELGFKILDDNATSIMANYLGRLSSDVGKVAGAKRLLESKSGLVLSADDKRVLRQIADEKGTEAANKAALAEHKVLKQKLLNSADEIRNEVVDKTTQARGAITTRVQEALDEIPKSAELKKVITDLGAVGRDLTKDRATAIKTYDDEIKKYGQNLYDIEQRVHRLEQEGLDAIEVAEQTKPGARGQLAKERAADRRRLLRELRANAEELTNDRETLRAIRERIAGAEAEAAPIARKAEILERNLGDESFIAAYGGENVRMPERPDMRPDAVRQPEAWMARRDQLLTERESLRHTIQTSRDPKTRLSARAQLDQVQQELDDLKGQTTQAVPASVTRERDQQLANNYAAANRDVKKYEDELYVLNKRLKQLNDPMGQAVVPPPTGWTNIDNAVKQLDTDIEKIQQRLAMWQDPESELARGRSIESRQTNIEVNEELLMRAWEQKTALERERATLEEGAGWQPGMTEPPDEVLDEIEKVTAEQKRLLTERNKAYAKRDAQAKAQGLEPVYSVNGRELTDEELTAQVEAKYAGQEARLRELRDAPEPKRPDRVDQNALERAENTATALGKQVEQLDVYERALNAATPTVPGVKDPLGRGVASELPMLSLPTLRRDLRVVEAQLAQVDATHDAMRAARQAVPTRRTAEHEALINQRRVLKAQIDNIVEGRVRDPATYQAEYARRATKLGNAKREMDAASAAEAEYNRAHTGRWKNTAEKKANAARARYKAAEDEWRKFIDTIKPDRRNGELDTKFRLAQEEAATLREQRIKRGQYPQRKAEHAIQVERAERGLPDLPRQMLAELERNKRQNIAGYRRPKLTPRARPNAERIHALEIASRDAALSVKERAAARTELQDLLAVSPTFTGVHRERINEIEQLLSARTPMEHDERVALTYELNYLKRPEAHAHRRERLMTPTDIKAAKADLAPAWKPPTGDNDPIKQAITTPQAESGGSPELGTRHGRVTNDISRAQVVTAELATRGAEPAPEWGAKLQAMQARSDVALANYQGFPAVGTAEVLDSVLAESRRHADFTLRYAEAVKHGAPPGDDLATHVLRNVIDSEREVIRAELNDLKNGKGVVDYEVEKTVDLFKNLIHDLDNASNQQEWARKLTAIKELEPGEQIVHLRNRISINEEAQATRRARLTKMRQRQTYAMEHLESKGRTPERPLHMQATAPLKETIETYQAEHAGAVSGSLSSVRRGPSTGRQTYNPRSGTWTSGPQLPARGKRRYTYTREEFREAKRKLRKIEDARAKNELQRVTRVEDIADLRTRLRSGEVSFTELLESDDPVVRNATVEQILMAIPPGMTPAVPNGVGRAQARDLMEEAGVSLRYKQPKAKVPVSPEAAARTPAENKALIAKYRAERRQARAYEESLTNPRARARLAQIGPPKPFEPTVTAAQASEAAAALKGVQTSQFIGPPSPIKELEPGVEGPKRIPAPGTLVKVKMSALGKEQRERLATLLGIEQPKPYQRSARLQRRFAGSETKRATNLAYDVEKLEREISGAEFGIRGMKEQLANIEEGGITSDVLAIKNLLETPAKKFDPLTHQVIEDAPAVINDEGLEILRRVMGDDNAESLRMVWNQAVTDDGQDFTSSMAAAYEFLTQVYGETDSRRVRDAMLNAADDPENMKTALREGAIHAAQQNTQAMFQSLDDSFRTLGMRFEGDGGLNSVLGYDQGKGTLNIEKLRDSVTRRVNRDREVFKNAELRRKAYLTRRDLRLDSASRALGKQPSQTTIPLIRAADKQGKEVLEGWMYTSGGNIRKFTDKDLAAGRLPELIPDTQGRKIKGIKTLVSDNPKGTVRKLRLDALAKMSPPTAPVRQGGMAVPRMEWQQVIGNLSKQEPVPPTGLMDVRGRWVRPAPDPGVMTPGKLAVAGGRPTGNLWKGSPAAQHRALTEAEQQFATAQTGATARVGQLQGQLAEIAERNAPNVAALPGAEAQVWQRKVEGDQLRAQLEQASGSVTRPIDEWQARIQTRIDDERRYTERSIEQFMDWKDAKTDQTSRVVAQVDEQLAQTREAIAHAEERKTLLDSQRAQLGADLKTLQKKAPSKALELQPYLDNIMDVASQRLDDGSPEMTMVETLLQEAGDRAGVLFMHDLADKQVDRVIELAKKGEFVKVMDHVLDDHWKHMAEGMLPPGRPGIVARADLKSAMVNVTEKTHTGELAKMIEFYTDFFKTYAVMSPGFQVRNAMSAAFMNATEGVGIRHTSEAGKLWREFRNDPIKFSRDHDIGGANPTRIGKAFEATLGSGAGGQFAERGVGPTITRSSLLFNNPLTRASKWGGEWVEGPVRLALGLHTIDRGASVHDALNRITRIHFDYSQVSKFDRQAKRLIPFYTFMSRNLPLQISQMYMKPKVYLWYQSMVRNLSEPNHPYTPGYWLEQGAFTMGGKMPGTDDDLYFAPDLPHTRVMQDIENLSDPARLLSNINPLARVPAEIIAKRKLYTGQQFTDTPEDIDWKMAPFTPILALLGQLQKGDQGQWQAKEPGAYAMRSLFPPLQQASRLLPNEDDEFNKDRQAQTMLRYIGIPAYQLNEQAMESERRRQEMAS